MIKTFRCSETEKLSLGRRSKRFGNIEVVARRKLRMIQTAAKLDQLIFPESIAYAHFSADGNRLLVLTRHQVAYVLDMSRVRSASPTAPESQRQ